jgi:hypothetical protein
MFLSFPSWQCIERPPLLPAVLIRPRDQLARTPLSLTAGVDDQNNVIDSLDV